MSARAILTTAARLRARDASNDASAARQRFGLLEKHKDYVERAKDYHRKEVRPPGTPGRAAAGPDAPAAVMRANAARARRRLPQDHLQLLREKASFRNPDEFYFAMERSRTKGGVHVVDGKRRYKESELRDMRSADIRYVRLRSQVESKVRPPVIVCA